MISKQIVVEKITSYLQHRITLSSLVDWAERAIQEEEFYERDTDLLMSIVSKVGLADVRSFGLTWEECESMLIKLGYRANINVVAQ